MGYTLKKLLSACYRHQAVLLLEAADNFIRLGVLEKNGFVKNQQLIEIPTGIIVNGELMDSSPIIRCIGDYLQDMNVRSAAILLNSSRAIIRFGHFPVMKNKELEKVVAASYTDYFPFDKEEMVISWKNTHIRAGRAEVMMIALPVTVSMSYVLLFEGMQMKINYIDIFESCVLDVFDENENIVIIFRKQKRINFLYLSDGSSEPALWDTSAAEADGTVEMMRSYSYHIMRTTGIKITAVYALCFCPDWVRAFFENENITFWQPGEYKTDENQICFHSAFLRLRKSRKKNEKITVDQ